MKNEHENLFYNKLLRLNCLLHSCKCTHTHNFEFLKLVSQRLERIISLTSLDMTSHLNDVFKLFTQRPNTGLDPEFHLTFHCLDLHFEVDKVTLALKQLDQTVTRSLVLSPSLLSLHSFITVISLA